MFGKSQTNTNVNREILTYPVSSSIKGTVRPVVLGMNRVPGYILWSNDWQKIKDPNNGKGKGGIGGKGGGGGESYVYESGIIIGLCRGAAPEIAGFGPYNGVKGIRTIWRDQVQYIVQSASEMFTIPSGGGSYTPSQSDLYLGDNGPGLMTPYSVVANDYGSPGPVTLTGVQMTPMEQVSGAPGAGQYHLNPTTYEYTFSGADAGLVVAINYTFYVVPGQNISGSPVQTLDFYFAEGALGQPVWPHLLSAHPEQLLAYSGTAYVANPSMLLGASGVAPNYSFEVQGLAMFGNGINSARPIDCINFALSDAIDGAGVNPALIGDQTGITNWCLANNVFLSPRLDSQRTASSLIKEWLQAANSEIILSDGLFKFRCYGDTTCVGNGATYIPDSLAPIYDLDDDWIQGDIEMEFVDQSEADNVVTVNYEDRDNGYNDDYVRELNEWSIGKYGLRDPGPVSITGLVNQKTAQTVASIILKNKTYKLRTYKVRIQHRGILLEPMDLVTLTRQEQDLYLTPVRIIKISEDSKQYLTLTCEDFPWGTAQPTLNPRQQQAQNNPGYFAAPGDINEPLFFEAVKEQTQNFGYLLDIMVSGGAFWGGANVWVSRDDGVTYSPIGQIFGGTITGSLTSALGTHPDPDTLNTLSVNLIECAGELPNWSRTDADMFQSLIIVDNELMAYETATLTAPGQYTTSNYLRRGVFGTTITPHLLGARFSTMYRNIFQWQYEVGDIGTTLKFKFTSFNQYGQNEQLLSDVPEYFYYVTGNASRPPYGPNGGSAVPVYKDEYYKVALMNVQTASEITEDGVVHSGIEIDPTIPTVRFSELIEGPVLNPVVTTAATGGTIVGGVRLYFSIAAVDTDGNLTDQSNVVFVDVPAGSTNTVTLDLEFYDTSASAALFIIYQGDYVGNLRSLGSHSLAASITLTSLSNVTGISYGMPDGVFHHFNALVTNVKLPGYYFGRIISKSVSGVHNTLGFDPITVGPGFTPSDLIGHVLSTIQHPGTGVVPIQNYKITANTSYGVTVDLPSSIPGSWTGPVPSYDIDEMVVVRLRPDTFTGDTIGDSLLSMAVDQWAGFVLRAFYADGTHQTAFIASNTASVFTLQSALNRGTPLYFWVEDSSFGPSVTMSPNDIAASPINGLFVEMTNITGAYAVLVLAADANNNVSIADFSPIRDFWWDGIPIDDGHIFSFVNGT